MLEKDPKDRPSIDEIINLEFIQEEVKNLIIKYPGKYDELKLLNDDSPMKLIHINKFTSPSC